MEKAEGARQQGKEEQEGLAPPREGWLQGSSRFQVSPPERALRSHGTQPGRARITRAREGRRAHGCNRGGEEESAHPEEGEGAGRQGREPGRGEESGGV